MLLCFSTEMSKSSYFYDWRKDAQGQRPVPNSEGAYIYVEISWKDFYLALNMLQRFDVHLGSSLQR